MDDLERILRVADDNEMDVIDDLMVRAGILWKCPECAWRNQEHDLECDGCGRGRKPQPV